MNELLQGCGEGSGCAVSAGRALSWLKPVVAFVACVVWAASGAAQTTTVYTDEAAFLAAISGSATVHEGFEDEPPWDAVRSTIFGGTHTAPSITNLGITWQSNHPANGITTGPGAAYSGGWGFYSYPHGDLSVPNLTDNIFDGFIGSSADTMTAVGGWFTGTANSNLVVLLDGGPQIGLGLVGPTFQFYGVVMTGGTFNGFEFREIDGTLEDQRIIFADEFTIAGNFPAANNPPNGTIDQPAGNPTITVNQSVTFAGSVSDPDGDTVTVLWDFGDGATSTQLSPGAHTYTTPGTFTVTFTATDVHGLSDPTPDTRTVTVNNTPPNGTIVAPAGNPTITVNQSVTFSGSASDPDGDAVTVLWQFGDGATSTLLSPGAHTYTTPGTYTVTFTATDVHGLSDPTPDTRTVTVNNTPPNGTIVEPAGNPTITVNGSVTFSGTASDPDGDAVTVLWQFGDGATSTLLSPGAHTYTVVGVYTVTFTATDVHGLADPTPATRTVTVNEPANNPPIANAGPDQTALVTQTVTLDGTGSSDPDGDPLTYAWSFTFKPAGSAATLVNPTSVSPSFTIDVPGDYTVQLIVNDGTVDSTPDSVTVSTQNSPPVANAGPDQSALVTQTVTLDGSGSSDVDGDPLTYAWSFSSKPVGSTAVLVNPTAVNPSFTIDEPGSYVVQLIVNDGTVDSAPDSVTVSTENSPPVANAGPDQSALVTQTVTLDGSGSSDVDGDPLTYAWSFSSKPVGSTAVLVNPTAVNPSFTIDEPGSYIVQLIVNDGTVNSAPDSVTVSTDNSPPVANAGPDQSALVTQTVTLDGSGSSDVDGDPLTYAWSFSSKPAGSTAVLVNPTAVHPSFTIDEPGTYVVQLVVNDGTVDSAADHVHISTENSAPVANAGPDQSALVTQTVTLDGSGSSDVDGDPLTYAWSFSSKPAGSTAVLVNPTAVNPSFTIDEPGSYVVQLIVNDGTVNSAPDTVTVSTDNSAPVANAGPDQSALVTQTVTLDGTGSYDVDGDPLTYAWSFSSKPAGSAAVLVNPTSANPSFTIDEPGSYVVRLIVNDGTVNSAPDSVTVSTDNSAPVANAGPDQSALVTQTVTLDGSGSNDVDGDPLTYAWSFSSKPAGSAATLTDPASVTPSFTIDVAGSYVVRLIVNDGTVNSAPDSVTVSTDNSAPVADAGPDQTVPVGGLAALDGSGSNDVDGDPLTYAWSFSSKPAGSAATLTDPTSVTPSFTVDASGSFVVRLIVNDGTVSSAPDTVVISTSNSAPVADAGVAQTVAVGETVFLDGRGSSDADGDPLTYAWSFASKPAGSTATLDAPTTVDPSFTADLAGRYIVQLIVHDGKVGSAPDTVTIKTENNPPNGVILRPAGDVTVAVGEAVDFEGSVEDPDGDPVSVRWSFGDGGTSDALVPSPHAYSQPGSYTVTFSAVDSQGAVDPTPDRRQITVTGQGAAVVAGVVSGVAAIRGLQGSDWHTDLYLHNASQDSVVVELSFGSGGGLVAGPVSWTVSPGWTETLHDVVGDVFGTEGSGAIFWRVLSGDGSRLLLNAETYNRVDAVRRYGQQVPGITWSTVPPAGTSQFVPALAGTYRTNLGLATDGDCTQVIVRGYDRQGSLRVERTLPVAPFSWMQLNQLFRSVFPELIPDPDGVTVADSLHRFEVVGVDGKVAVYTSIIDNVSNDGSYMAGQYVGGGTQPRWLPGAASTQGINNSQWRSDVIAFNLSDATQDAVMTFFPSGSDNGGELESRAMAMSPEGGLFVGNVLQSLFALAPPAVGSLGADLSDGLFWMRTYTEETDAAAGELTYGQAIPAHDATRAISVGSEGRIFGLTADEVTRANLVLQNMCRDSLNQLGPVDLRVTLLDRQGYSVAERSYTLRAGEYLQHNQFMPDYGVSTLAGAALRVVLEPVGDQCTSGGVAAMVSEVNGATIPGTNDARLVTGSVLPAP